MLSRLTRKHFSTLLIGMQKDGKLNPATLCGLTAALQLNKDIDVLLTGPETKQMTENQEQMLPLHSNLTKKILFCEKEFKTADIYADFLENLVKNKNYTHVVAPSTGFSKDYFPRFSG